MSSTDTNIRLNGVQIMESFIKPMPKGFEGISFNFNINVETRIDATKELIVSIVKVEIMELGKKPILAMVSTGVGIEIIGLDDIIKLDENNVVKIPSDLDIVIKTIAISTSRGVIFSELKGTYLHQAFLPLIFQTPPSE